MSLTTWLVHGAIHAGGSLFGPLGRTISTAANYTTPIEPPPIDVLIDLRLRGWISDSALTALARGQGIALDTSKQASYGSATPGIKVLENAWNQVFYARQELPTIHDILTLTNRGLMDETGMDAFMRRLGYFDTDVRAIMSNLRYEIPGSSDLVRFSVRHVFEPDLIERLGYNDEFRPILDFWHRLQGLNYPLFAGPFAQSIAAFEQQRGLTPGSFLRTYEDVGLADPTWAQAFWWSHWVVPSPSQAYEMYFRLRPGRNRAFDPPFARDLNFTIEDLNLNLRANDYPPRVRGALAAIAHRIPGIRFLRQLRATEVFTQADVKELLLRQGYSDGDASVLAESVERADRDQRRKLIEQQAKGQLAKYWELGAIDGYEYRRQLIQHGLTAREANDTVILADLDLRYQRLKQVVQFVRRQMLSGSINGAQAADQLRQAGVVQERIVTFINDWQLEVQVKHREISAQKAVQWACKGLITVDDLRNRLANLNYLPADSAALVAEAELCQASLATRAAAKADRASRQAERELVRQQKAAAQAIVTARRQLASHGSPAQLRKWYCAGHVGQMEVYSRLRFLGWPDADITRLIGDCQSAKSSGKGGQRGGATLGG